MFFKKLIVRFCIFMDKVYFQIPSKEDSWYIQAFLLDKKWKTRIISDEGGYL